MIKLSEAIIKFENYLKVTYSDKTVRTYVLALNCFMRFVKDKPIDEISFDDILDFKSHLYNKQNISSSVCVYLSALACFLNFLKKAYKISPVPIEDLKILRPKVSQKIPPSLDKNSIQMLINACKNIEEEIIIKLLFYTGMRASEMLNLTEKDIIKKDNCIFLRIKGKGGYERMIPIDSIKDTFTLYFEYKKIKYPKSDKLFPLNYNTLYYRVKKIAQRAGLDEVSPHWLRHSCATELLTQGVDIRVIAEICGHKSLNTTMRYAKVKPQLAKKALEKLL